MSSRIVKATEFRRSAIGGSARIVVPFKRRHFDCDLVTLCVRRYPGTRFSLRESARVMAERGLPVAHTTLMRWMQRGIPGPDAEQCFLDRSPGRLWSVEESRIRIRGRWHHLHRAVDATRETLDFWLSDEQDVAAVWAFFNKALGHPSPDAQSQEQGGPKRA